MAKFPIQYSTREPSGRGPSVRAGIQVPEIKGGSGLIKVAEREAGRS